MCFLVEQFDLCRVLRTASLGSIQVAAVSREEKEMNLILFTGKANVALNRFEIAIARAPERLFPTKSPANIDIHIYEQKEKTLNQRISLSKRRENVMRSRKWPIKLRTLGVADLMRSFPSLVHGHKKFSSSSILKKLNITIMRVSWGIVLPYRP
jgi:hypothetical protein